MDLAVISERLVAGLIDNMILLIPSIILVGAMESVLPSTLLYAAYVGFMMSDQFGGQTIGYKVMKLKLVDQSTGQLVPVGRTALLGCILSFVGFIGWIWYFTDDNRRMLHNIATKTVVVNLKAQH